MAQGKPLTHFQVVYYYGLHHGYPLTVPGYGDVEESTYSFFYFETQEEGKWRSGDEEHGVQVGLRGDLAR